MELKYLNPERAFEIYYMSRENINNMDYKKDFGINDLDIALTEYTHKKNLANPPYIFTIVFQILGESSEEINNRWLALSEETRLDYWNRIMDYLAD